MGLTIIAADLYGRWSVPEFHSSGSLLAVGAVVTGAGMAGAYTGAGLRKLAGSALAR